MKKNDCIFCSIANKEINADIILEGDNFIAFNDVNPQAPIHVLVIPKKHYENIHSLTDIVIMNEVIKGIQEVIKKLNIEDGYRIITNTGESGGQTVNHLHFHILSGRPLLWPPG